MKLVYKELKLATSPLSWLFLAFACMTLIPGYPILLGAFFVCLGLFQSAQRWGESGDILFSVLLPIPKREVVTAKYLTAMLLELIACAVMALLTALRLTVLRNAPVYANNALLAANFTFLGLAPAIFGLYNILFLGGFFRTAYKIGKPFVLFIVCTMLLVGLAETLPHIPGLAFLGAYQGQELFRQLPVLAAGLVFFFGGSFASLKLAQKRFVTIDL